MPPRKKKLTMEELKQNLRNFIRRSQRPKFKTSYKKRYEVIPAQPFNKDGQRISAQAYIGNNKHRQQIYVSAKKWEVVPSSEYKYAMPGRHYGYVRKNGMFQSGGTLVGVNQGESYFLFKGYRPGSSIFSLQWNDIKTLWIKPKNLTRKRKKKV